MGREKADNNERKSYERINAKRKEKRWRKTSKINDFGAET